MWQLEEVNLRLKKLVTVQSLNNATCSACWQKRTNAGAVERMASRSAGTLRGQRTAGLFALRISRSSFRYRSVAAYDSALPGISVKLRKVAYITATGGFTSCSGWREGHT